MAQMQDAAGEARHKAQEVGGKARGRAREQVDQRSTEAGQRVSTTAGDIRSVSDELRKQGKDGPAKVADQVADRAERVGGYLQEADSDRILHDIEEAGRRQPWAVVAGGIALGFAASRFLKASSHCAPRDANCLAISCVAEGEIGHSWLASWSGLSASTQNGLS